jgi:hypothetical protein
MKPRQTSAPQQFAQGSHFAIDGCIAVAAFTQRADHRIKHLLRKDAETLSAQYLTISPRKDRTLGLVRAFIPEDADILRSQIAERVFLEQSLGCTIRLETFTVCVADFDVFDGFWFGNNDCVCSTCADYCNEGCSGAE